MEQLTREEAIELLNEEVIEAVEALNCEMTGRCMLPHEKDWVEFNAVLHFNEHPEFKKEFPDNVFVEVYYYQKLSDIESEDVQLDDLTWIPSHYEIY